MWLYFIHWFLNIASCRSTSFFHYWNDLSWDVLKINVKVISHLPIFLVVEEAHVLKYQCWSHSLPLPLPCIDFRLKQTAMYFYYHLIHQVIYICNSPQRESIKYESIQRTWPLHFYASEHAILYFMRVYIWTEMLKYMYATVIQLHRLPKIDVWTWGIPRDAI